MASEPAAPPRGAKPMRNSRGFGSGRKSGGLWGSNHRSSHSDDDDEMMHMADIELSVSHDQLPSPEEYKATAAASASATAASSSNPSRSLHNSSKRNRKKMLFYIGIPIAIVSIMIIIATSVRSNKNQQQDTADANSKNPSQPSSSDGGASDPRLSRMEAMVALVVAQQWSAAELVKKEGTAQFRAALWVADYDGKALPVDEASLDLRQRYALATLYFALDGRSWSRDTGFLTDVDVCDWFEKPESSAEEADDPASSLDPLGVDCRCSPVDPNDSDTSEFPCRANSVKKIKIPSAKLDGTIPNEIQLLVDLEELDLHDNYISGTSAVPDAFRNMTKKLKTISLQFNALQGELPSWIGELTSVKTLNLASNKLNGTLPSGILEMSSLRVLNLDDNQMSGSLTTLQGMSNVQALILGKNQFSGQLTSDLLASWSQVDVLDLGDNDLNGPLPSNIFMQPHLAVLDLHGNDFTEAIPEADVQSYDSPALQFLALQGNQLSGPIPSSLGRLKRLYHLDLAHNKLIGSIPIELGTLTDLKYLFLAFNDFDAEPIPDFLQALTNLVDLSLQRTQRTGVIPDFMGNLDKMWLLDLGKNQLSGGIPNALTNCTELRFLILYDNLLEGEVPANIRDLQNLHYLILDGNSIGGQVSGYCNPALPAIESIRMTCNRDFPTATEPYCPCCDCCGDAGVDCDTTIWYGDFDPSWNTQYVRDKYQFHDKEESPYLVDPALDGSNGTPIVPGIENPTPAPAPAPGPTLFESDPAFDDADSDPSTNPDADEDPDDILDAGGDPVDPLEEDSNYGEVDNGGVEDEDPDDILDAGGDPVDPLEEDPNSGEVDPGADPVDPDDFGQDLP